VYHLKVFGFLAGKSAPEIGRALFYSMTLGAQLNMRKRHIHF
jgi:hypothetical protein